MNEPQSNEGAELPPDRPTSTSPELTLLPDRGDFVGEAVPLPNPVNPPGLTDDEIEPPIERHGAAEWAEKYLDKSFLWAMGFYRENLIDAPDEYLRFHGTSDMRLIYLSRLLKKDRGAIIPLLHEWEALKVQRLKLEKYWRPTPFPCER
ncbi:MAG: hypothetical protein Q8K93_27065 [Reyranella sp.]|uniref:hypothetical protein n=1 Tax=Reyranella sp. TaxID=1929291 RepID=UPI002731237B|nr:hypothetical protein [Reyranella sp.]MDP1965855.1 hypothetical protein [Reyranella sp.]MDP2377290.1 hypothetical protein [Reyranella sp.]